MKIILRPNAPVFLSNGGMYHPIDHELAELVAATDDHYVVRPRDADHDGLVLRSEVIDEPNEVAVLEIMAS